MLIKHSWRTCTSKVIKQIELPVAVRLSGRVRKHKRLSVSDKWKTWRGHMNFPTMSHFKWHRFLRQFVVQDLDASSKVLHENVVINPILIIQSCSLQSIFNQSRFGEQGLQKLGELQSRTFRKYRLACLFFHTAPSATAQCLTISWTLLQYYTNNDTRLPMWQHGSSMVIVCLPLLYCRCSVVFFFFNIYIFVKRTSSGSFWLLKCKILFPLEKDTL